MADRRLWRGIDADLFRFATTDLRELHLALMAAFEEAAVLAPALNLDQVRGALADVGWSEPLDDVALGRSLQALVGWGLLEATQDHAAHYSTPEEFERKNLQWSLTRRGEAAVGGVLHALDELRHAVGLQPAVLDAIGDALDELADRLSRSTGASESARVHILLAEAEGLLTSLVTSVRQFNGHLQRLLREEATDDDVFIDVKRRTISYLEQYVDGVERPQRRLKHAVERLGTMGLESLFDQALTGANLAPVAGGDPAPWWLAERNRRWLALQAWFAPEDDSAPRITGLLDIARTAIIELLRVLERRWDSRRRSASVANDFRRWPAGSRRRPATPMPISCSAPRSDSGRRDTPTCRPSISMGEARPLPGLPPSRWMSHPHCAPQATSRIEATCALCPTPPKFGPVGRQRRLASLPKRTKFARC